jgi:TAG lipase/steryl ester hydrolase/phospholipase A2/LPA acyltransferase
VQLFRPTGDKQEENNVQKSLSRPALRTASTHLTLRKKYMSPTVKPWSRSTHATPLPTPQVGDLGLMKNALDLHLQLPDFSSAGETTHSPPSSDADIDSHTDESSPEPDAEANEVPSLGLYYGPNNQTCRAPEVVDFFSATQPVTSGTDHVLATSPLSCRANLGLTLSPVSMAWRSGDFGKSTTTPSSPEMIYKHLFPPQSPAKQEKHRASQ